MNNSKTYWPILSLDHSSWFTDLPCEGITIDDDGFISDCSIDAQGFYIRTNYEGKASWDFPSKTDPIYRRAYKELFEQIVDHSPSQLVYTRACKVLEELGWKEVIYEEDNKGRYFKYAN